MQDYMLLVSTQAWMNSRPLSTLTDFSITRKIMDKEMEHGKMRNQAALFHMTWRFHEGGQEFRWLTRDEASYMLTQHANASGIGNGHKTGVPPLNQWEPILGDGNRR